MDSLAKDMLQFGNGRNFTNLASILPLCKFLLLFGTYRPNATAGHLVKEFGMT